MRIYTAILLILLFGISASHAQSRRQLTQAEAVRLAEEFVAQNGYTDLPPMQDKTKLSYESIDSSNPAERLKDRYNTLERKAYAVGRGNVSKYGWTIVFRYNANNERYRRMIQNYDEYAKKVGRAIQINADGSNIRIVHQDIYLSGLRIIRSADKAGR